MTGLETFTKTPKLYMSIWTMDGGSWHCTGDRGQDHPHGKEMQKSKMAVERREVKSKGENEITARVDILLNPPFLANYYFFFLLQETSPAITTVTVTTTTLL